MTTRHLLRHKRSINVECEKEVSHISSTKHTRFFVAGERKGEEGDKRAGEREGGREGDSERGREGEGERDEEREGGARDRGREKISEEQRFVESLWMRTIVQGR